MSLASGKGGSHVAVHRSTTGEGHDSHESVRGKDVESVPLPAPAEKESPSVYAAITYG